MKLDIVIICNARLASRPGHATGARIETNDLQFKNKREIGRPGHATGARIETL